MDFHLFKNSYKPHVRPDDMAANLRRAFRLDAKFAAEFKRLKPYLQTGRGDWGDLVVMSLSERSALAKSMKDDDLRQLLSLYRNHSAIFRAGNFDETYLDSVEDIALFLRFHEIKTLWVASVYRDLTEQMIDLVCDRARLNRHVPIKGLLHALSCGLAVELNQIQRTFTMYERYVSDALVKDLSMGGMLTSAPTGGGKLGNRGPLNGPLTKTAN